MLQTVSKQLDSMTRPLEDKLLLEGEETVNATEEEEEIAEARDEVEDSDFKLIDNKEDEEPEEIEPATELECAEDELEDKDSNCELELVDNELDKLRVEE